MSILALRRDIREVKQMLQQLQHQVSLLSLGVGEPHPVFLKADQIDERYEGMAHFIKNRQHMAPVPSTLLDTNKAHVVKQELRVSEDGAEILPWTEVAFDASSGEEQPPLPEYWAEVDKTITREGRFTYNDGFVTEPFSENYMQVDNFSPPQPAPQDLGEADQIDEVDADVRPS